MRGGKRERIEKAVEFGASAVLAVAVGFSLFELLQANIAQPYLAIGTAWSAAAAFLVSFRFLRALGARGPDFKVRPFELPGFSFDDLEELLLTEQVELILTDADRVKPGRRSAEEELILNDILAKLEPDSRVVRLFDPTAMPTPAQLNDRIERHLRVSTPRADPPDASDALYQALNELRRSLR